MWVDGEERKTPIILRSIGQRSRSFKLEIDIFSPPPLSVQYLDLVNFYAPLRRKRAYCFAPVGRSVGRYVGRSVDQTMSAQYLENLLLDCYDISYVGWL